MDNTRTIICDYHVYKTKDYEYRWHGGDLISVHKKDGTLCSPAIIITLEGGLKSLEKIVMAKIYERETSNWEARG